MKLLQIYTFIHKLLFNFKKLGSCRIMHQAIQVSFYSANKGENILMYFRWCKELSSSV